MRLVMCIYLELLLVLHYIDTISDVKHLKFYYVFKY